MGRKKDPSIFDMIDDWQKAAIKRENERIREANRVNTLENENKVKRWNEEIEEKLDLIDNYYKDINLEVFDSFEYYDFLKKKLFIKSYVPLQEPSKKELKKRVRTIKENKVLEKIFKKRTEERLELEKRFQLKWDSLYNDYLEKEKENKKEYDEYKSKTILKNEEYNKEIDNRYELFESGDKEEVENVVKDYLNNSEDLKEKNSIGVDKIGVNISDNVRDWTINLRFAKPEIYLMKVKDYKYIKSKWEIKENYFSDFEREKMFKKIVFNSNIYYLFKIKSYFEQFIKNIIVNSYVEDYNGATGQLEEKCIFSSEC